MATIIDQKITVAFDLAESVAIDLSDDGYEVLLEQMGETVSIPRAELGQFCAILCTWNAEHPRAAS